MRRREWNVLYVSFCALIGSSKEQREAAETGLINHYGPTCSEKRNVAPDWLWRSTGQSAVSGESKVHITSAPIRVSAVDARQTKLLPPRAGYFWSRIWLERCGFDGIDRQDGEQYRMTSERFLVRSHNTAPGSSIAFAASAAAPVGCSSRHSAEPRPFVPGLALRGRLRAGAGLTIAKTLF